jgi:hypothetical protein
MTGRELIPLTAYDQVPEHMTEEEARQFWDTHEITEEYLASMPPLRDEDFPPIGQLREYGPIELDFETFRKARWLARQRGMSLEDLIGDLVDQSIATRSYRKKRDDGSAEQSAPASAGEKAPLRATGS